MSKFQIIFLLFFYSAYMQCENSKRKSWILLIPILLSVVDFSTQKNWF